MLPAIVTITRCDLSQMFVLNLDDREYMSMPVPQPPSIEELQARAAQRPKPAVQPQPTLLIETTTEDTGQGKQMFGYTARHVITTVRQIPLVESGQIPQETTTDGWYIDLDTLVSCDPQRQLKGLTGVLTVTREILGAMEGLENRRKCLFSRMSEKAGNGFRSTGPRKSSARLVPCPMSQRRKKNKSQTKWK